MRVLAMFENFDIVNKLVKILQLENLKKFGKCIF